MRAELRNRLRESGLDPQAVDDLVRAALAEDGEADVTSEPIFDADSVAGADVVTRRPGVAAGLPVATVVFETLGLSVKPMAADGDRIAAGDTLLSVEGPLLGLLRAERTALNFLTHLSGVATLTRRWADAVEGTGARVRDTRKTLPGLRALQKYAVRCGGGVNHRMSLQDAALIKDNHVAAAGSVTAAFTAVRAPGLHVQVECDTLDQVREALAAGASSILLDNMGIAEMTQAVRFAGGKAELEASGGLTLDGARDVASTGVDYLAVGALTHSAPSLDIGLDLTQRGPDAAHHRRR
ncbi:MAG: nicotinate-nucleotide pyrophosphorylase [Actinoallomurus sp.]|nr:nicotinate-nucleotide pyrophosphorylase [Actinoallomurus sp.]